MNYLPIISTFSAMIPILAGVWGKFYRQWPYRLFLIFLLLGFLIDLGGWYMYVSQNSGGNWVLRYTYTLTEPLFYLWFLGYFTHSLIMSKMTKIFMGISFLYWLVVLAHHPAFSGYYIFYGVSLAFFSGFLVLEIVERNKEERFPLTFWLTFGIFFYNLSTFFIKGLLNSQIAVQLWFLQNLVNIVTNVIFAMGFWLSWKRILQEESVDKVIIS